MVNLQTGTLECYSKLAYNHRIACLEVIEQGKRYGRKRSLQSGDTYVYEELCTNLKVSILNRVKGASKHNLGRQMGHAYSLGIGSWRHGCDSKWGRIVGGVEVVEVEVVDVNL